MIRQEARSLPHWAKVAFITRCATRLLPMYENDSPEPAVARIAVTQAIKLAGCRAELGGEFGFPDGDCPILDGQYFDNYDIDALVSALWAFEEAALNTYVDLEPDEHAEMILDLTTLARLALLSSFEQEAIPAKRVIAAIRLASSAYEVFRPDVLRDFQTICSKARIENWTNVTAVSSKVFGQIWTAGKPACWLKQP